MQKKPTASGDFDGDGDIYLCNYESPNQLFLNQGNNGQGEPQFQESAQTAGIALNDASLDAKLCDYDRDGGGTFRILPPVISGIAIPGDARSLNAIDYVGNNRPDLLMARNSAPLQLLINNASGTFLKIRLLSSAKGNHHAIGARVVVHRKDDTQEAHQITAGGGYLSQSPAEFFVSFNAKIQSGKPSSSGPTEHTAKRNFPSI